MVVSLTTSFRSRWLGDVRDEALSGEQEAADRSCILQGGTCYLGRINHTAGNEVLVSTRRDVVADATFSVLDVLDDKRSFDSRIGCELTKGRLHGACHDFCTGLLVALQATDLTDQSTGTNESCATAGNDSLFHGRAGRVKSVLDAGFLLFHLGLGGCTDIDHSNTTSELGKPLLEFLAIVIGRGLFDLTTNLVDPAGDVSTCALTLDEGCSFLRDGNACRTKIIELTFSSLMPRSSVMTCQPVRIAISSSMALRRSPKPGALTAATFRVPRDLVDHESRECFPFDVFRNDEEWRTGLSYFLERGQHDP